MHHDRQRTYARIQFLIPFAIFALLAGSTVNTFFSGDDVMNLFTYLSHPLSHWTDGALHFWSSAWYRPVGGIVYLMVFKLFGFHPLPFKLLLLMLLAVNLLLYQRVCNLLAGEWQVTAWAALLFCYHASMYSLYLSFGTIYDVLGFTCYFGSLFIYAKFSGGTRNTPLWTAAILLLYVIGLGAKEIVVTLPAVLLAFALLCTNGVKIERWSWLWRSGLPIVLCSIAGVIYTLGKTSGSDSLVTQAEYTPHYSLHQFAATSAHYIRELFFLPKQLPTPTGACWIFILLLALAIRLRSRLLAFSGIAIVLSQAPLLFIMPRDAFAVYIAFGFWAIYIAVLLDKTCAALRSQHRVFAAFVAASVLLTILHFHHKPHYDSKLTTQLAQYEAFSRQLDDWHLRPNSTSRVLLMNDPFAAGWNGWDPMFIVNDRAGASTVVVTRVKLAANVPPVSEAASYDYVIDYDKQWRLLRKPGFDSPDVDARLRSIASSAEIQLLEGFFPAAQAQWRYIKPEFDLGICPQRNGPHRLTISLWTSMPTHFSAQLDQQMSIDQGMRGPGIFDLSVPIATDDPHKLTLKATGHAQLIFINAEMTKTR